MRYRLVGLLRRDGGFMGWISRRFGKRSETRSGPAVADGEPGIPMPRRLLLMLRELHGMGYERLRAVTGMSHSGCHWRLHITPAIGSAPPDQGVDFLAKQNARVAVGDWVVYLSGKGVAACFDGSDRNGTCFGWEDAARDSPRQLAEKFLQRFPSVTCEGRGDDPEYSAWYSGMIEATEPEGLIYMYSDWEMPSDRIPVLNMTGIFIPPPPRVDDGPSPTRGAEDPGPFEPSNPV